MWILVVVLAITTPGTLSSHGVLALTNAIGPVLLMGLGLAGAVVAGCIDLSIVQIGEAAGLAAAAALQHGSSAVMAVLIGLLVGAGIGFVNGLMVSYVRISSLMTTLAMSLVLSGAELMYMHGPQAILLSNLYSPGANSLSSFGRGSIGSVGLIFMCSAVMAVVAWILLSRTMVGRRVVLSGQGSAAAWYAGVDPRRSALAAMTWSGLLGAAGGIGFIAQSGIAVPGGIRDFLVPVFAGVLVGAVVGRNLRVTVATTLFGVVFVMVLENALTVYGLSAWVTYVTEGLVLVGIFALLAPFVRVGASRSPARRRESRPRSSGRSDDALAGMPAVK
jgi:ribose/xylose/arabinose/galactoside ABC-type transport system permease subunit